MFNLNKISVAFTILHQYNSNRCNKQRCAWLKNCVNSGYDFKLAFVVFKTILTLTCLKLFVFAFMLSGQYVFRLAII